MSHLFAMEAVARRPGPLIVERHAEGAIHREGGLARPVARPEPPSPHARLSPLGSISGIVAVRPYFPYFCEAGQGMIAWATAAASGQTVNCLPFCHW